MVLLLLVAQIRFSLFHKTITLDNKAPNIFGSTIFSILDLDLRLVLALIFILLSTKELFK